MAGKPQWKRLLRRPKHKWMKNINVYVRRDRLLWLDLNGSEHGLMAASVNTVMNVRLYKSRKFLTIRIIIRCLIKTLNYRLYQFSAYYSKHYLYYWKVFSYYSSISEGIYSSVTFIVSYTLCINIWQWRVSSSGIWYWAVW